MGTRLALMALLLAAALAAGGEAWREQGVLHLSHSPHARLHSIPVRGGKLRGSTYPLPVKSFGARCRRLHRGACAGAAV
jgi:hypothetical protein